MIVLFFRCDNIISVIETFKLYRVFTFVIILINFQKNDPWKAWVKISKVMPQPKSTPPGKGGKP